MTAKKKEKKKERTKSILVADIKAMEQRLVELIVYFSYIF